MANKYDYEEAMTADINDWLAENAEDFVNEDGIIDEQMEDRIYDQLWNDDSVTGNASGSYWYNYWKAEEAICHNLDLLRDAVEDMMGGDVGKCLESAENADVTIRCYLLCGMLRKCVEEWNENHGKKEEAEETM